MKYVNVVQVISDIHANRIDSEVGQYEKEKYQLFNWLLWKLVGEIQEYWQPKDSYKVTVKEGISSTREHVLLRYKLEEYHSKYVDEEEFYSVMKDVANEINKVGEMLKDGYRFHAKCNSKRGCSELTVTMERIM